MRQGRQGRQGDKEDKGTRETRGQGRKFNHAIPQNKVVRLLGLSTESEYELTS